VDMSMEDEMRDTPPIVHLEEKVRKERKIKGSSIIVISSNPA